MVDGLVSGELSANFWTLVDRGGRARAKHMPLVTGKNVRDYVVKNADPKSRLHTDESRLYPVLGKDFAKHETVNHSAKEYARPDVTSNSVEGFLGIFKRGMVGLYKHCGEQHPQRYLDILLPLYQPLQDGDRGRRAQCPGDPGRRW
jgi:hypothetical protein